MRSRIGIAAVAVIAVWVAPWYLAPVAHAGGGSGPAALHILRLKPPPKNAYPALHQWVRWHWGDNAPTGLDGAGNMIMFDGCCDAVRYSTTRHVWLPGFVDSVGSDSAIVPTEKGFVWVLTGVFKDIFKSVFNLHVPTHFTGKFGGLGRWASVGGLAPVANGSGWLVGWYGHGFQWSHAALEYVNAYTMKPGRVLHVPDPYTPDNVSVGPDGKVWILDPWTKCNGVSCIGPHFISYDPKAHRFTSYFIPRSVWPRGWRGNHYTRSGGLATKIAVAPDGSVWAALGGEWTPRCPSGGPSALNVCGVRLFELQNGTIRTRWFPQLNLSSRENTNFGYRAPLIVDSSGNPWLCGKGGTPESVNAATWAVSPTGLHGGTLTEDGHHNVWYVIKTIGQLNPGC